MGKKVIIVAISLIAFILICFSLSRKDEEKLNEYNADIICHNTYFEVIDENEINSTSNVYIYETDGYIDRIINQSITNDMSSEQFLSELVDLYNQVEGIKATVDLINNELVMEISYDYKVLDLKIFKSKIGNLLSKDSVYFNLDSFPISVEKYKSYELENYECEVK